MSAPSRSERASVLMLMPAAVLIVLLLGAIAVDSAIIYLEQRQAYNVAFDAANDAVGAGFDRETARRTGEIVYDAARVREVAEQTIAASSADGLTLVDAVPDGSGGVAVTVEVAVRHVFVPAFGGDDDPVRITARAMGVVAGP